MVHPLSQQLHRRLSPVCVQRGHVQIIHKDHTLLPKWRPIYTLQVTNTVAVVIVTVVIVVAVAIIVVVAVAGTISVVVVVMCAQQLGVLQT